MGPWSCSGSIEPTLLSTVQDWTSERSSLYVPFEVAMLPLAVTRERLAWQYSSWRNPVWSASESAMGEDSRMGGAEEEGKEERRVPSH
jgi:hypothetical protein